VQLDGALVIGAAETSRAASLSFWDALILGAAMRHGCERLLTENLRHGFEHRGVCVENPFALSNRRASARAGHRLHLRRRLTRGAFSCYRGSMRFSIRLGFPWLVVLALTLPAACGGGDEPLDGGSADAASNGEPDAGARDAAVASDGGRDEDAGGDAGDGDAGAEADAGEDAGAESDAGGATDAGLDAGPGTDAGVVDPGPVQCRGDGDCGGSAFCNRDAPGGVCNGCGSIADCPSGTDCTAFGACVRSCESDADCNVGFRCLGSGRCGLRTCTSDDDCGPYVCGTEGRCARPSCADGAPCPGPLTCEAGLCVEP
jgi:hypothetical protein